MTRCSSAFAVRVLVLACCAGILPAIGNEWVRADSTGAGPQAEAVPLGPPTPAATAAATPHDIALLVAQLGDDDPKVRDAASRRLAAVGKIALPALRDAARGDDPEIASRARRLLAGFRYGIDPDTPAALMDLVNQYRADPGQGRQRVIQQLAGMGWAGYRVLARIRRQETDAAWRNVLAGPLHTEGPNVVNEARQMIQAARDDDAEARLQDAAGGGDGLVVRSYVALILARGKLDATLRELQAEVGETPGPDDALLLAFLCRAKDDSESAMRYARQIPPGTPGIISEGQELTREIMRDRHDWAPLIADASKRADDAANPNLRRIALAEKVSYARLAGDAKAFSDALVAIKTEVQQSDPAAQPDTALIGQVARQYAPALLLNDRSSDGIDLLVKGKNYSVAWHLMVAQGRYADAQRLLDDAKSDNAPDLNELDLAAARRHAWLGEKEAAAAIVDRIEKAIGPGAPLAVQGDLIDAELALGRTDAAFDRAAAAIAAGGAAPNGVNNAEGILRHLVPANPGLALGWRAYLAGQHPNTAPAELLHKIWALFARKLPPAEAESLLREAADNAATVEKPADRQAIFQRVTQTAEMIGREDLADAYFAKWADDPSPEAVGWFPWKHLGDRAAAKKDFPRAVDCYERAVKMAPQEPICLWLHGWATEQAAIGDTDKLAGARLEMRRADELLLADDSRWLGFIQMIGEAGADATSEAEPQRELMRLIGQPGSWEVNESYRLSARALLPTSSGADEMEVPDSPDAPNRAGPRYLRAADLLSQWILRLAYGNSTFIMSEAYLMQPSLIHSLRARGLIAGGDIAAAMKEADLSLSSLPANSQLPIDLVPALDRQGRKAEADALFRKVAAAVEADINRHPQCPELHNGFAWMSAKCDRDLDKGLESARQATTLAPDSVAFLDTLAEVQFHRGERQAAIDTMKHCIEMDPHFAYLQGQLRRFTNEARPKAATQP